MKMNKKGVTLLELIVVFVIIAIGAGLMVPNLRPWMDNYRLRSATRDITSTLRVAQMRAVSNNFDYGVAFYIAARQFQLYRSSGGLAPDGPLNDLPKGIQFNAVNNVPVDPTLNVPFARFFPNSSSNVASQGDIILINSRGFLKTIIVRQSTGRITIQ